MSISKFGIKKEKELKEAFKKLGFDFSVHRDLKIIVIYKGTDDALGGTLRIDLISKKTIAINTYGKMVVFIERPL